MKQRDSKMPVLISFQMFRRFSTFFFVESAFSKLLKTSRPGFGSQAWFVEFSLARRGIRS